MGSSIGWEPAGCSTIRLVDFPRKIMLALTIVVLAGAEQYVYTISVP
jgi:hypothetical protein